MSKRRKLRTWADEIADLEDPTPKDFDPEQPDRGTSGEEGSQDDGTEATNHYIDVGKSRLRNAPAISLGPKYSGLHISRDNLLEPVEASDDDPFASAQSRQGSSSDKSDSGEYADPDKVDVGMGNHIDQDDEIDSDEAFGEGDEEKFQGFTFRAFQEAYQDSSDHQELNGYMKGGSIREDSVGFGDVDSEGMDTTTMTHGMNGEDDTSAEVHSWSEMAMDEAEDTQMRDDESLLSGIDGSESEISSSDTDDVSIHPPADDDRAALRKMMAESQKTLTSNLSKAAKSDIAKGRAINSQRKTFESLLNTRIRLQKALISANALQAPTSPSNTTTDPAVTAVEQAALTLWTTLDSLRQSLSHPASPSQTALEPTPKTPLSILWTRMQSHEAESYPLRTSTLNKWSARTAPVSSLPRTNKFSTTPVQQPLSEVLEQQLTSTANIEKLIAKTQIPRSCAPLPPSDKTALPLTKPTRNAEEEDTTPTTSKPKPELIYDDTPFYTLLLQDLLTSRSASSIGGDQLLPNNSIP
ncbi:MAG: hypothetical protein L6R41_007228, partial [Letrouitia leprolyta]